MKAKLTCVLIVCGICFAQPSDRSEFFENKSVPGLPFAWPALGDQPGTDAVRKEDVLRLLQQLFPPDALETVFALESFRFAPLEKGKLWLVAVTDTNGRAFFNSLKMVRCDSNQCKMAGFGSDGDNDLNDQIVDIDGDGIFEIITRQIAGSYDGASTRPIYVYSIRTLAAGQLLDVSNKYPEYFRDHILPKIEAEKKDMEARIASADRPVPISIKDLDGSQKLTLEEENMRRQGELEQKLWKVKAIAELEYVQDEYHLRVLGEKTAGLENALNWARSVDPEIQRFGLRALERIDSPAAAAELQRLASSPDQGTSEEARNALDQRAERGFSAPPKQIK